MSKKQLCPICEKKHADPAYRPFCSKRCADVDLSRWLSDGYAIPGQSVEEAEETPDWGGEARKSGFD